MGRQYSVTGEVFEDRKVGTTLGFPTVNIKIDDQKHRLKSGVYAGKITVDGNEYKAVINYGARPTFGLDASLIEAHLIGFSGQLYGRELKVRFDDFLRDVKKFDSVEQLKLQIEKDLERVKNYD